MTITKITFEQLFPTGIYANQRLGIEITLSPEIHPVNVRVSVNEAYEYAKSIISDAFVKMNPEYAHVPNPNPTEPAEVQVIPTIDRKVVERLEILIDNAETLNELMGYAEEAKKQGIESHWLKRQIEFQQIKY